MNPIFFKPLQRESTSKGRFYTLPDGKTKVPSVTNIIDGVISKGPALQHWIANEERKLCVDVAEQTFKALTGEDGAAQFMTPENFRAMMTESLGKPKGFSRKLSFAADLGTAAHNEIARRIDQQLGKSVPGPQPIPEGAELVLMAYEDYCKTHDIRYLASEGCVYDSFAGYAGCLDILAMVDGALTVIDIKSSKKVWRTQRLQLAAYQACASRHPALKGIPIQSMILRLPKTLEDIRIEPVIIEAQEHEENLRSFLYTRALWGWLNEFRYTPPMRPAFSSKAPPFKRWAPTRPIPAATGR